MFMFFRGAILSWNWLKGQFAAKAFTGKKKRNMVPVKIFPYTILEYLRIAHQAIDRKQNIILNISISLDWLDELLETTYIRFSQYKWFSPNPMKY